MMKVVVYFPVGIRPMYRVSSGMAQIERSSEVTEPLVDEDGFVLKTLDNALVCEWGGKTPWLFPPLPNLGN
ncbi:hypothetical protein J3458_009540 [Metarhizium acridum]|uniref:uncharacterized protein n=1 Tax=Metarhizium acridum TaxID=92637 RepID=UPI001C6CEA95|nr:hypothetical protein J3458_009540 [Metarhizium acridum]